MLNKFVVLVSFLFVSNLYASLESKLDSLNIPDDKVSPVISKDKLYIVNTRYSSLVNRHELTMGGSNDFLPDSHMDTKQFLATYRYHINSDWSLGLRYSSYSNKLTPAGEKLYEEKNLLPDSDYALKSTEIFGNYNLFYGKLRVSDKQVVYFDNYLALGFGEVELAQGNTSVYSADIGLAFWLGKNFSSRFGLKNEFYTQKKLDGETLTHNMMGYIEFGYLFGEGNRL